MSLIAQVREKQVAARKGKEVLAAALYTTLLGEALAIGKNAGDREPTDAEVVQLVKKFMKGIDESIGYLKDDNPAAQATLKAERKLLEAFTPSQLTDYELTAVVQGMKAQGLPAIMKHLKETYPGQYDGKKASEIAKRVLAS